MSDFLLDTDVLVRCLRGAPETLELARRLTDEGDLHISVWSQLELLTLVRPNEEQATLEFLTPFIPHPVNDAVGYRAAQLMREAAAEGSSLTFAQAVIAATAIQHGLMLVTYGPGSLPRVTQVKLYPITPEAQRG